MTGKATMASRDCALTETDSSFVSRTASGNRLRIGGNADCIISNSGCRMLASAAPAASVWLRSRYQPPVARARPPRKWSSVEGEALMIVSGRFILATSRTARASRAESPMELMPSVTSTIREPVGTDAAIDGSFSSSATRFVAPARGIAANACSRPAGSVSCADSTAI